MEDAVTGPTDGSGAQPTRAVYRLEVEGRVGPEWAAWFGAATVEAVNGTSVLQLVVADQSELHGLLRRVHDLHLPLVSLSRVARGADADAWVVPEPPVSPV
jgi:hypothetical protein